ncbi:MAG TPA: pilin [Candidatus Paceibacterota bacterium]|nr:pilin [Candidatus Paceibacterota bacterium]
MKKLFTCTILSLGILAGLTMPFIALAATVATCTNCNLSYTPLEPIPGVTTGANLTSPDSLSVIVNAIFTILISVGALLAVLMLTIGGIQYMVSSAITTKQQGLKRAQAALWGIVLIAASWLILHTINPYLTQITLNPCLPGDTTCTVTGTAAPTAATPALTQEQIAAQATQTIVNGVNPSDSESLQNITAAEQTLQQQNATQQTACIYNHGTPLSGTEGSQNDPRIACGSNGKYTNCTSIVSPQPSQAIGLGGVAGLVYECGYNN